MWSIVSHMFSPLGGLPSSVGPYFRISVLKRTTIFTIVNVYYWKKRALSEKVGAIKLFIHRIAGLVAFG